MKAVQFARYGGPEVLEIAEIDEPHAGPGRVRIAVRAAGVNGIDWKLRAGYLQEMQPLDFPAGTGMDAAGAIDQVGADVTDVAVGDAVFGTGTATYAEYAVLTSWAVMPQGLSFEEAAGYPVPVETAVRVINQVGIKSGQTLLVSGASGGVGSSVLQIARDRGITVIGTASASNQDYLRSLGARATTYGDGLVERVRALAPDGIDAALDLAGSGVIPELIELTGAPGTVVSIADFGASKYGAQVSGTPEHQTAAYAEAARLFGQGNFRLRIDKCFPLAEAATAHAASAEGHAAGRIIITVA
jgi:NADPH:quinone reductase-like Zn-dependent oxidoreductase